MAVRRKEDAMGVSAGGHPPSRLAEDQGVGAHQAGLDPMIGR